MFQLRRSNVGCDSRPPSSGAFEEETVLLLETTKIGRNPEAVDVVLTSTVHSNMISRIHSTIEAKQDKDRIVYILTDQSLNGTYINDYRAKGPTELKPGDIIKFGHVNGAAIRPGCHGPQHSAEFTFIFEKAPEGRMERRRPITIVGGARNNAEQSHTLIGQSLANDSRNQHTASRLPLTTSTSVEFPTWQTAAGTGAQQFYNLQRFPSYYPAAFSQINPAYLQQLWQQQNAWQQPVAAAQHLQQQQQQLQQQQHKQQQAALMSEPLMDSSWMSASVATDLQSSATSGGHFRAPTIQQTVVSHTQPLGASSAASVAAQNPQAVARFAATNFATGMMPGGANLLSSFAQRMCQQQQQQQPSNVATSGMSSSSAAAIAAAGGFPISASSQFAASTIASTVPPTVTAASTTVTTASSSPNMDNVKRMECDSSVPSPPKTQVTTAVTGAGPASTHITSGFHPRLFGAASSSSSSPAHQHAVKASTIRESCSAGLDTTVPMGGSPPRATTSLAQPVLPSSSSTALLLTQSKTTPAPTSNNQQQTSNAAINQVKANAKQEIDAPRTETESTPSHFSPASVSPESVPPKMVPTPASTTGTSRGRSPRSPLVKAESSVISSQSRSPSHHSPKRRGHGHSESSRSRSPTPAPSDVEKTSKKVRKSNEVARLLNDLTEGAWMGVARKSAKKNETNNSKTRAKTSDEDESSWSDSEKEPPKKAALKKKPGRKPRTSTTSSYQAATSESTEKRRRGRPPKRPKRVMPARKSTDSPTKKTGGTSKRSQPARAASRFESSSSSEDEESEPEEEEQKQTTPKKPSRELKKLGVVPNSSSGSAATPTNGNRTARRSAASASGGATATGGAATSATPSSSTNSTPKKRGRPAKTPAIFREVSSDSSLMSSDSSISPRAKRKYTMPQRKVGMAPIMSNKKTPTRSAAKAKKSPAGKKVSATKKKPGRKSGGSAASSASKKTPAKVKRKKKNSESSSSSESEPEESLSESESRNTSAKAVLDEWSYHDPDKLCDAKTKCKKPQGENVDWVQCDLCDLWYHVECAVGYSEVLDEGEFDCGCKKKPSRKRARK